MADDTHPITVRVTELTFQILQARERVDGIACATRLAQWAEEWAERERHASNLIQRAIESQQQPATPTNKGGKP